MSTVAIWRPWPPRCAPGKTRLIWLDSPANPTWDVSDIAAVAEIAREARARLAVDSTAATPVLTRPLELGADLVVHSASKYLNGHSDVLAGALVTAQADAFWQRIRAWRRDAGAVLGPFEAWLLLRGMRTLFVRVERSSETALAIAQHFEDHPKILKVLYPGLPSHPSHQVARRQMTGGFGGMLSLRIRGGEATAVATAAEVKVFKRATSLGGVESLIEHRASIEGPSTPVPTDLLRLSIGLEDPKDLIADLEQAIARSAAAADHSKMSPDSVADPGAIGQETGIAPRIEALLAERLRPLVADRGGDLVMESIEEGIAELRLLGSPGATLPLKNAITNMIRHHLPEITEVRLATAPSPRADQERAERASPEAALSARLEAVLEEEINPAVQHHGGRISLVKLEETIAYLRFEARCQGCAMAEVTLRQGVEVIIKDRIPEILAVVDVTDHAKGTDPYFKTKKGST